MHAGKQVSGRAESETLATPLTKPTLHPACAALLLVVGLAGAAGCSLPDSLRPASAPQRESSTTTLDVPTKPSQTAPLTEPLAEPIILRGHCSWYGPGFHGGLTASGESFNQADLTAAHATLPFGTILLVSDPTSQRSVRVRVNDRGPYVEGRILDISRAAAIQLGIETVGVAEVEIRILAAPIGAALRTAYAVQVGAYRDRDRAARRARELADDQSHSGRYYLKNPDRRSPFYRVRRGPFRGITEARGVARQLSASGLGCLVVEEDQSGLDPVVFVSSETSPSSSVSPALQNGGSPHPTDVGDVDASNQSR